jgi:hypothetical protein
MTKVQGKLKECVEKQCMTMESLERLSNALHTTSALDDDNNDNTTMMTDDEKNAVAVTTESSALADELRAAKELKGENRALGTGAAIHKKKRIRTKHGHKSVGSKQEQKEKKRPRYFVQF